MENNANANGEEVEEMEFDCDVMGNSSTMRKGGKREGDCYEIHGNSVRFMGQDPPPNLRGMNFSPHFFTKPMDNASTVRKGMKERNDDCYEIQGKFDDFMAQDPPPNMDNASTMRKGDNIREFVCNEIHGNSHDFIGQDPPPNSRGTNFSPLFFTQHDSVPDFLEVRKVFEPPPSPEWSYRWSHSSWDDYDEPPMLPPLLAATDMYGASTKPHFATLSHLYIEQSPHGAAGAAISSTERFQDKYVTAVVDKPSDR